jgi:hypothetical protein
MGDSYGLRVPPDGSVKAYFYAGGSSWPSVISGEFTCSSGYIDDKGVRPSDHIPMTVIYRFN